MGQHRSLRALQGVLVLVTLSACGSDDSAERPIDSTPSAVSAVTPPPTDGGFDYQLGGAYPPPDGVTVVERDSTADPVDGTYSICYVNGFQTQPGVDWPRDLLVPGDDGTPLVDPGWPDEHLLDLSTPAQRDAAAARQQNTIDECARKGFRAVEFDNLDSYSRSRGAFTLDDAVAFATDLTTRAHRARLAVAQKNTADLESRGRDEVGFDFAVTEECDRFDECDSFTAVYGGQVLDIEYTDDLRGSVADICARSATPAMTVVRDRDLVPRGDPAYRYARC
ncbi:endo alpha-1,4 polygalactosaminidase [Williamsia herbipolensis]|uniref:endo alpha-1,4 polygalactosaminidase n=1 Tax=Williamsia herbipolensis TaxID=1603258 RepID=UPI000A70C62B|nr:endo alpha-1,4 polygalactosaminidase [Williamsia herbipolensis]